MPSAIKKRNTVNRANQKLKANSMTKEEMVRKMLDDQKIIREAIQNGVSFQELREKYGYEFKTL